MKKCNYNRNRNLRFFLLSLLLATALIAQGKMPISGNFGISLLNLQPRGEFAEFVTNDGWGVNLNGAIHFWQSPLSVGLNVIATSYGSETQDIPFNYWAGSLVTVEMETTNSFFSGHIFLRLMPHQWPIQPYADALFGFNTLTTETSIRDEDDWDEDDDNEIASSTNLVDNTFSYGAGGGVMIRLYSPRINTNNGGGDSEMSLGGIYLDLGCKYLIGGEAEYLNVNKEGWITTTDPADGPIETTFHPD